MTSQNLFTGLLGAGLVAAAAALAHQAPTPSPTTSQPPGVAVPTPANATTASSSAVSVRVAVDHSVVADTETSGFALVEVRGSDGAETTRTPVAMTLVIDTSGSMAGAKIEHARQAAVSVVEQLSDGDLVSVVAYDTSARVVVAAEELGRERGHVTAAIRSLAPTGNTCMSCGMTDAYRLVRESPSDFARRVIVLSDGQANAGISDARGLAQLAQRASAERITTSTIGLGSDYDERLMVAVATASAGGYYFLPEASEIAVIFDRELRAAQTAVARDVSIRFEGSEGVEIDLAGVRGASASADGGTVRLHQLAAGEIRRFVLPLRYVAEGAHSVGAVVAFRDATGEATSVSAALEVDRSPDPSRVAASVNPEVVAEVEMRRALADAEEAMEDAVEGELDAAAARLDDAVQRLERQSRDLGDERLAEEARNIGRLRSAVSAPGFAGGDQGRGLYLQNAARASEAASGVAREQMYHEQTVY